MAKERAKAQGGIRSDSESVLEISKTIAAHLSEEGLVLATLLIPDPNPLSFSWGAALTLLAVGLLVWEQGYGERPPVIVGPYRFVRNPHSLSFWLLSLGLAIAARSFPGVILVLILLPWLFYLEHEEQGSRPDTRLLRYRFHVPAMIPTLLPFEKSPNKGFSWRRSLQVVKKPTLARLASVFMVWAYLLISFNLKLPWWGGMIAAAFFIGIKLFLSQRKILQFTFRKKVRISPKT